MFNQENDVLAKTQQIELEILKEVHKICVENSIVYWLEGGTLLGAIRHGGFIPWDDDIDIAMDRKNYENFLKIAQDKLPKGLFLQHPSTDPGFKLEMIKIRKDGTKIVEKGQSFVEPFHQGIFIDIILCDYFKYSWLVKFMRWGDVLKEKRHRYKKGSLRRFFVTLYSNVIMWLPYHIWKVIKNYARKHKEWFESTDYEYLTHTLDFGITHDTKTKDILPVILGEKIFEGQSFYIPNNPHEYLKCYYDEHYMLLPPIEQRHWHNELIILNTKKGI